MEHSLIPKKNLTLGRGVGAGITIYASTIKQILLTGQASNPNGGYIEPYILQAIRAAFKRIMKKHDELFVVKRDIYSPGNISKKKIVKCFPRFAEAYVTIRNGEDVEDEHIRDDITYAELLDVNSHVEIYVIPPHRASIKLKEFA